MKAVLETLIPDHVGPGIAVKDRRLPGIERGPRLTFLVDGAERTAYQGETVAAALLATGRRTVRWTERRAEPRGLFCGMGICFDCLVCIDGRPNQRACQIPVVPGMVVETPGFAVRQGRQS